MTENVELMRRQSLEIDKKKEEWIVQVNRDKFYINGEELEILKKATEEGYRGLVWFDNFAISIAHIQTISRYYEPKSKGPEYAGLSSPGGTSEPFSEISDEKWDELRKRAHRAVGKIKKDNDTKKI